MNPRKLLNNNFKSLKIFGYYLLDILCKFLLSILFIIIFQPVALLMKFFGYDPLNKKMNRNSQKSYREKISKTKKDFKSTY